MKKIYYNYITRLSTVFQTISIQILIPIFINIIKNILKLKYKINKTYKEIIQYISIIIQKLFILSETNHIVIIKKSTNYTKLRIYITTLCLFKLSNENVFISLFELYFYIIFIYLIKQKYNYKYIIKIKMLSKRKMLSVFLCLMCLIIYLLYTSPTISYYRIVTNYKSTVIKTDNPNKYILLWNEFFDSKDWGIGGDTVDEKVFINFCLYYNKFSNNQILSSFMFLKNI